MASTSSRPRPPPRSPRPGSVYYLGVTNFMCYREAGFYPGRGLNVLLGPNGSGKSSLASAACLALGGDLSVLNRQSEVGQVVGQQGGDKGEARVRIKLWRPLQDQGGGGDVDKGKSGRNPRVWDIEVTIYRAKKRKPR